MRQNNSVYNILQTTGIGLSRGFFELTTIMAIYQIIPNLRHYPHLFF